MKIGDRCNYMCDIDRNKLKISTQQVRMRVLDEINHLWVNLRRNIYLRINQPIVTHIYNENRK